MKRLGILGSTRGTLLLPILNAIQEKKLAANIEVVISNKKDALLLKRASEYGLRMQYLDPSYLSREAYDQRLSDFLQFLRVDTIVLLGYMRILSADFVAKWRHKIINTHPSLLPAFAGKMDLDVHRAVLSTGVKETGCTVHYVTEDVDAGPIILQKKCAVDAEDTPESLKARVQSLEAEALILALHKLCDIPNNV